MNSSKDNICLTLYFFDKFYLCDVETILFIYISISNAVVVVCQI